MSIFSWIYKRKTPKRKSKDEWLMELIDLPDWQLQNIVRNPGEFTIEMREAAAETLHKRTPG